MRSRDNPAQLSALVAVQRVRRVAVEASLRDARDAERTATASRDTAAERLADAEACWLEHVTAAAFAPERSQSLATVVIANEIVADRASHHLRGCQTMFERCDEAWRMAEAQVRSIERDHASAVRDADRRLEEKRLAERDDRTMRKWGQA